MPKGRRKTRRARRGSLNPEVAPRVGIGLGNFLAARQPLGAHLPRRKPNGHMKGKKRRLLTEVGGGTPEPYEIDSTYGTTTDPNRLLLFLGELLREAALLRGVREW